MRLLIRSLPLCRSFQFTTAVRMTSFSNAWPLSRSIVRRFAGHRDLPGHQAVGPILAGHDLVRRIDLNAFGQRIRQRELDPPAETAIVEHLQIDAVDVRREQRTVRIAGRRAAARQDKRKQRTEDRRQKTEDGYYPERPARPQRSVFRPPSSALRFCWVICHLLAPPPGLPWPGRPPPCPAICRRPYRNTGGRLGVCPCGNRTGRP